MKKTIILGMLLCIIITLTGCGSDDAEVKIGFIAPLSGQLAELGQDIKDGVELFENTHPDLKVVYEDDKFEPKESLTAYRKLRDIDNMKWFIGPFGATATSTVYGGMTDQDKTESVVVGFTLCIDEFKDYVNTLCAYPSMREQVTNAINFADSLGRKKGYIVTETTVLGEIFTKFAKEAAKNNNQKIIGIEKIDFTTETAFYTYVTKIISKKPDFVFLGTSLPPATMQFVKILKEQGISVPILVGSDLEEDLLAEFKTVLEGVYFTGFNKDEYAEEFIQDFTTTHNKTPNIYSAIGYELAAAAYAAQKKGNTGKDALVDEINENDFAIINFVYEDYDAKIPLQIKQVRNATLVPVS